MPAGRTLRLQRDSEEDMGGQLDYNGLQGFRNETSHLEDYGFSSSTATAKNYPHSPIR